jgi:hypothetical protein
MHGRTPAPVKGVIVMSPKTKKAKAADAQVEQDAQEILELLRQADPSDIPSIKDFVNLKARQSKNEDLILGYAPTFMDAFAETAFQTLYEYLQHNGQPEEVYSLLDCLYSICVYWALLLRNGGKLDKAETGYLSEVLSKASRHIVKLGGKFYSPTGSIISADEVSHV